MKKYRLVIHTNKCLNRFNPKYVQAQKFLDNEVLKDSSQYVPFRTGNLMKSGITGTVIGSGEIKYNAPYARRMYYGVNFHFRKDKHPLATAQWFEKAKAQYKEEWLKSVQKIIEGEATIG